MAKGNSGAGFTDEQILRVIQRSLGRKRKTFGHGFPAGYQTVNLRGRTYQGQRDTARRIEDMCGDDDAEALEGRSVLDIGCNIGGVLHGMSEYIDYGVGVDSNAKAINAANMIALHNDTGHVHFYTFDVNSEPLDDLRDLSGLDYDTVLCLSVGLWCSPWREIVEWSRSNKCDLFYETNGVEEFQREQESCLRQHYRNVTRLTERSEDDARPGDAAKRRRLYLCTA